MTDILLAKPQLQAGEIDWATGEATLVRRNLFKHFPSLYDPMLLTMDRGLAMRDLEYPPPAGYRPLVELLEQKHGAPVVITNGAKQGLAAVFHSLAQRIHRGKYAQGTKTLLWLQKIHWALLPPLARTHGLDLGFADPQPSEIFTNEPDFGYVRLCPGAYLLLAPNNPCGATPSYQAMQEMHAYFKDHQMPLVHDAAYYTHSYLPEDYQLGPVGDVQVFSFSKMWGLSGVRGGYVVCYDKAFYKDLIEYQEMMTVGVSILTQKFLWQVMHKMRDNPNTAWAFERANYAELKEAKQMLKEIPSTILEVPDDVEKTPGMFFWGRLLDREAFQRAKIHIVGGEPFGDAGKVRLNLGLEQETLRECIKRLQEVS